MEYERLCDLIRELDISLENILTSEDPNADRDAYAESLQQKYFDFNEECRINEKVEGPTECILHFKGLRKKFESLYRKYFQYDNGNKIYNPTGEIIEGYSKGPRLQIIGTKEHFITESIGYLSGYIDEFNEKIKDQTIQCLFHSKTIPLFHSKSIPL